MYIDAVQGQDTSVRDATSKRRDVHGPHHPRDTFFNRWNVLDICPGTHRSGTHHHVIAIPPSLTHHLTSFILSLSLSFFVPVRNFYF
jgi:hypothetical protein